MNQSIELATIRNQTLALSDTVCLNSSTEELTITRSFYCEKPFFYALCEGHFWWAHNYVELIHRLKFAGIALSINRNYIRDYIAYQAPLTWETLFSPIQFLRMGEIHTIAVPENRLQECNFESGRIGSPITGTGFENALDAQLQNLDPSSTVYHLSSGLDSSLLALLSARTHNPKSVLMASCVTRGAGCSSELDLVHRLANDIGGQLLIYDFSGVDIFDAGNSLISKCLGYPLAHSSHLVEYCLDRAIVADGYQTIVNGKGPDDCLAGYATHMPNYSNSSNHQKRLKVTDDVTLKSLFGSANGNAKQFWLTSEPTLRLQSRQYYDARALTDSWNVIHSAIAKHLNCEIVSPFMHSTIRQGLFSLDDSNRVFANEQKVFMRNTFRDLYPDYILNQPKAAFRLDLKPYFRDFDAGSLLSKILGESGRADPSLNESMVQYMIDQTLGNGQNFGWQLWSLYLVYLAIDNLQNIELTPQKI